MAMVNGSQSRRYSIETGRVQSTTHGSREAGNHQNILCSLTMFMSHMKIPNCARYPTSQTPIMAPVIEVFMSIGPSAPKATINPGEIINTHHTAKRILRRLIFMADTIRDQPHEFQRLCEIRAFLVYEDPLGMST